ncbi:hypothetical protein IQ31_05566 [Sphingobacterium siyangense]|uniref:Uncharacterized protein n=1 Tax=Sphingobacterium siyangense TaxID=459529 RepID=A0A562LZC1_9SPHI|nr:hypothetical protein IQ31_05566 [Sphingobacterium siyangense]
MDGVDKYASVAGFVMETVTLFQECIGKSCTHQGKGGKAAQDQVGQCADKSTDGQTTDKRTYAPIDKLALETAVNKGPLQPLIDWITPVCHTPKNALMTTDTSTKNRQEPPHDINSLLMS